MCVLIDVSPATTGRALSYDIALIWCPDADCILHDILTLIPSVWQLATL